MEDLYRLGEGIRTLSVVPVGLTKYNAHRPVRPLHASEARGAIQQVDRLRLRARGERGSGWVYAADEMYLHAGLELPGADYYDSWDLTENGVGSVRGFLEAFREGLPQVPRLEGRRIRILTGRSMAPFMEDLAPDLRAATGAQVLVHEAENEFYGELVTVAGLLAGRDLVEAAPEPRPEDLILIPAEALNADDLLIDSFSFAELGEALAPAQLVSGLDLIEALRKL
jgi:NifB/MoaA-like Fe-S oxidoreductase